jgi:ATP-dependent RNA helicase RhlE
LAEFKDGSLTVLVATDIAARGIDIDQLPHVVNYDLPNVPEDYVHRIGRTGRAGATGEAVSLVCVDEFKLLADIEKLIKRQLPQEIIDGFIPDPHAKAQPIQLRSQPPAGQHRGARPSGANKAPSKASGNRNPARAAHSGNGNSNGNGNRSANGNAGGNRSGAPKVSQSTPRRSGGRGGA